MHHGIVTRGFIFPHLCLALINERNLKYFNKSATVHLPEFGGPNRNGSRAAFGPYTSRNLRSPLLKVYTDILTVGQRPTFDQFEIIIRDGFNIICVRNLTKCLPYQMHGKKTYLCQAYFTDCIYICLSLNYCINILRVHCNFESFIVLS